MGHYHRLKSTWLEQVDLGVMLWTGTYEGHEVTLLRWCDASGQLLRSGAEGIALEQQRAERYAAKLRALGIDPESD